MKNVNKANILIEIKMLANFQHFFAQPFMEELKSSKKLE